VNGVARDGGLGQKPKILIFSLAYHPFVGGAEVAIKEITDRLGGDFEFDMVTANLDGRQKATEKIGNINVHRIGNGKLGKYLFPCLAYRYSKKLQAKNSYDMIWAMMANQAGWAAMRFKKKFPKVKYLLSLQEGDSEWDIWLRTFFIRPIYKSIYRRADKIQAISNFLKNRAVRLGAKGDIVVVPNGVKVQNVEIKTQNYNSKLKQIITVSRLVKKNGVADLIKAMTDVNGKLIIIGDGKLKNSLESLRNRLNLTDKIDFWGKIDNRQVYNALRDTTVFVRPSLTEGLGNAFLEAMSVGVPVVGTKVGGIPDFLEDKKTGYFCEVKNPKSIAKKINYILAEENKAEVEQVVENAKRLVEDRYSWNRIYIDIKKIIDKLIS